MSLTRVLLITSDFTSFVSEIYSCEKLLVVGILDCLPSSVLKAYSSTLKIPYKILSKQDEELICWIKEQEPDVIAVFKMPFLLKEEIFSLPKFGSLNLHPSLLPDYRGPNPWFWIYYNMESESGVTIHFIDKGEDTGDIVSQKRFHIPLGTKLEEIKRMSLQLGIDLMIEALCNITLIKRKPQPILSLFRAKNIFNYEGLIDWQSWNVRRIWHLLNGFPDILKTNQSYLFLQKEFFPYDYCMKVSNSRLQIGEFIFLDNYYTLYCIDGVIRFLEKTF